MELDFTKSELNDLRDVLRIEIKSIKKEIRTSQDTRVINHLYNCIDNYEALEKKIASYVKTLKA